MPGMVRFYRIGIDVCVFCRRTLKHYESHDIVSSHVFTVPVSTNHVYSHVERLALNRNCVSGEMIL